MEPLFQHLKPSEPTQSTGAARQLAGLEDIERHIGAQTAPRTITDPITKRKFIAQHTLTVGAADVAPYERDYPAGIVHLDRLDARTIERRTTTAIRHLSEKLEDQPSHTINIPGAGGRYRQTAVIGFASGVDITDPFTVAHLGGTRWRVSGGTVRGGGIDANTQTLAGGDVDLAAGFLGYWLTLTPSLAESETNYIYTITPGALVGEESYEHSGPYLALTGDDEIYAEYLPGKMFLPVGYVDTTGRVRITEFFRGGEIVFPAEYPRPGVPVPTVGGTTE